MKLDDLRKVAVIGAGDMGHGIAEVALLAGYKVSLRDIKKELVERGVNRLRQSLDKLLNKKKVSKELYDRINNELLQSTVDLEEAVRG
ncbi:MAG TPA: 3-hydroxyacyl-CoA dehydrogenase, partial [Deltaproteobacteria bacterium]|nr:3-hydroxyacyl-CoA dehydrogenase [Deltaproteobacteria bacterium]